MLIRSLAYRTCFLLFLLFLASLGKKLFTNFLNSVGLALRILCNSDRSLMRIAFMLFGHCSCMTSGLLMGSSSHLHREANIRQCPNTSSRCCRWIYRNTRSLSASIRNSRFSHNYKTGIYMVLSWYQHPNTSVPILLHHPSTGCFFRFLSVCHNSQDDLTANWADLVLCFSKCLGITQTHPFASWSVRCWVTSVSFDESQSA